MPLVQRKRYIDSLDVYEREGHTAPELLLGWIFGSVARLRCKIFHIFSHKLVAESKLRDVWKDWECVHCGRRWTWQQDFKGGYQPFNDSWVVSGKRQEITPPVGDRPVRIKAPRPTPKGSP